ncbi:CD180 antigen [Anomaloglossus baeobatrachus]|uniref:CD180 antigen n=1 Tax=Anomaloglossus baeobatrachus TaxID=238106 RepID=UPI003F4F5D14
MAFSVCFVFLLVFYPLLSQESAQSVEPACSEIIANRTYSCDGLGLQEIPKVIPSSTENLDFSFNSLFALYSWMFSRFENLKYIDLSRCGINWIYNEAFWNNARLNTIILIGNPIIYIADIAFLGATSLEHLYLQETSIPDLSFIPLKTLKGLVTLHLGGNFISSIRFPEDITFPNLALVNFALNQIQTISVQDSTFLKEIKNLTLILKGNNIKYIEPTSFNHSDFHHLDLTGCAWNTDISSLLNGLSGLTTHTLSIGTFRDITVDNDVLSSSLTGLCNISVKELSLQYRHLSEDSKESFSCFTKIEKLDLTAMNLYSLPNVSQPNDIKELILNENFFSSLCQINSDSYPFVTHLYIVGNRNTWSLGSKCLEHLSILKYLDLSHNDFQNELCCTSQLSGLHNLLYLNLSFGPPLPLDSPAFPASKQLEVLDLSYVLLLINESSSPFSNLGDLRTLNLSYSYVNSSYIKMFEGLTKLIYLNLDGNVFHNKILKGENLLSKVLQLETLILSNCDLEVIENQALQRLRNLKSVDLSHNKLTSFATNAFENLSDISLNFAFNMISTIPIGLLRNISNKTTINLSYNPIDCSCSNIEFLTWYKEHENIFLDTTNTMCASPPSLAGTELMKVSITCRFTVTYIILIIVSVIIIILTICLVQYYRRRVYAAI